MENKIIIENPKGSYKSFEIEDDPIWKDYPLSGVTYPVDYGYIEGYISEDGHDLDIFSGSGARNGFIKIWRCDIPIETKFVMNVTDVEWNEIVKIFSPVIKEQKIFDTEDEFRKVLSLYKKSNGKDNNSEEQRQKAKEDAVLLALQNDMALIRRDLEIWGMKKDGSTILIAKSSSYDDLWQDVLIALKIKL